MHGEDDVKAPGQHHLQAKKEGPEATRLGGAWSRCSPMALRRNKPH